MTDHVHGTYAGYKTHACRCIYCAAWMRVSKRVGNTKPLLTQIAEVAAKGAPLPASADTRRTIGISTLDQKTMAAKHGPVEVAVAEAHQARLRAVTEANGSTAALALLAVAEVTSDPVLELRYRRAGLALAEDAA